MAEYISALNGQQMDAALTEVALYNPEAWAVGQRNGVPVTSADETWHNNAKYYAQVAQSAIPGTYTAAVRWDIAQGLAGESQEQARANISAGASNRNLLDNPWFRIDQRSVSGTITSGYIADRWTIAYGSGGVTASRTDNSVTVKSTSGSSHGDIVQRIEKSLFDFLVGKTVTASVMRSDGSVISKSFTFQSAANSINVGPDLDGNLISVRVYQTSTYQDVQFWKWNTAGTFRAVKLELGSYSTLVNDVPPDYRTELDKCQYYFERVKAGGLAIALGAGYNDGYNTLYGIYKIKRKRIQPTMSGSSLLVGATSLNVTASGQTIYTYGENGDLVLQIVSNNTFTTNQMYRFGLPSNGYLDFSADL